MNKQIFREYDIRGVVDQDFNAQDALKLGAAFARMTGLESPKIVVGYDGRLSSPELEESLVQGLMKAGAHVTRIGLVATPVVYFASHLIQADGAIMITGSHNPADQNGFKLMMAGKPFYGEQIQALGDAIDAVIPELKTGQSETRDIIPAYLKHLSDDYAQHYPRNDFRIAWDPGNGATGHILKEFLENFPGTHFLINDEVDGTFPNHHPDPTILENLEQLKDVVLENNCDFGIAFDGDGDRLGIIDAHGHIIWADQMMRLFAQEILKNQPGATIIADVKTSDSFFSYVTSLGGKPLMWRTGHSLIKTKLKEINAPFAGEMSGHIFFNDRNYGFDDAIYAAMRLVGILAHGNMNITSWAHNLPKSFTTPEIRIPCETLDKQGVIQKIQDILKAQGQTYDGIDGLRLSTSEGWWLLRASNTQEILVARAEAKSKENLNNLLHIIDEYLIKTGIQARLVESYGTG